VGLRPKQIWFINRLILNKTITLERKNNRAHRHRSKSFWGAQDTHLDTIKKYYQNLKLLPEEPL
jgi:hypothetical protein